MALYKYHYIELDTKRSPRISLQNIVAGETGNRLWITVTNNGETVDMSEKEDGEYIYRVCLVIKSNLGVRRQDSATEDSGIAFIDANTGDHGKVNILLSKDSFTAGKNRARLEIYSTRSEENDTLIVSAEWTFDVEGADEGDNVGLATPLLVQYEQQAEYFANLAEEAVQGGIVDPTVTEWLETKSNHIDGVIEDEVDDWLDEHPEATTTVEDGAVTTAKLADGAVTPEKLDESATDIVAYTFSTSKAYPAGDYVIYSGALYRFTADKAAGSWDATKVVAVALADDVSDLKGALDQYVLDRYDFVYPTNWYNPTEVESGEIYKDGSLHASTTRSHTGYIPVQEGDKVQLFRTGPITAAYRRHVACYDANKVVVPNTGSDTWNDGAYTIPSGVKYVIYTFDNALISQTFKLIIVRDGIKPTRYTPYFEPYSEIIDDFITPETEGIVNKVKNNELSTTNLINRYGCALPHTTLRQTVGMSEVWYFVNMGTPNGCEYSVTNAGNPLKRLNKGVEFSNTTALTSSYGFYCSMYDILLNVIRQDKASGQGYPRRIVAENLSNCTVLAIGDSTIDSDYLTGRMLSYFNDKGKTLTLLGTLGDGSETNRNEGRSGWKASDYFTNKKYNGVTNPFYNPTSQTFDFAYYMTNQGYTAPDFVILQLGINDMYNSYSTDGIIESTYGYIKDMVDSILAYNGNIKVLINLPTPPNSDKSRHTNTEFLYWNTIIRYNDYALIQIKATYEESKVRCTYCHLILDPDTDIADTVHPTQDGYSKMAMEVINQINCWQNGA